MVGFDNVHTINVVNGRSSQDNLPNVADAGGRSIVAKSAKRVPGYSTGIGVLQLHNSLPLTWYLDFDTQRRVMRRSGLRSEEKSERLS